MDFATAGEQLKSLLKLDAPRVDETVVALVQAAVVLLCSLWLANWTSDRIQSIAKGRQANREAAAVVSRFVALAIYGVAAAILLSIFGANATAIAAILGAATFGISLALQDVAKGFVNGIYILLERPYRIGDSVRIGGAEGRVEEIGVRVTRLRADGGDRILVPNTVVFSSVIENATSGRLDRQLYTLTGVKQPVASIEGAVIEALKGVPHLANRKPIVRITEAGPDGASLDVTIESDLGHRIDNVVLDRFSAAFPEATAATGQSTASTGSM